MGKLILGLATMNAGLRMPGASLTNLLAYKDVFDHVICIDGALDEEGKHLYSKYPDNLTYVDSRWYGSLRVQYNELLSRMSPGDWWVMLDDDEVPSEGLIEFFKFMRTNLQAGKPAMQGFLSESVKSIATPRVTCFTEDGLNFYPGETLKEDGKEDRASDAGPRTHIFYVDKDIKMMGSPAGRHVVPYYENSAVIQMSGKNLCHFHLKAPEMYVYNDCVKAIFDHDIKNKTIEEHYISVLKENKIFNGEDFISVTKRKDLTKSFTDFCIKYKDNPAPEGRMFIWYYNIMHPELNPYPEQDWTQSLKKVLNPSWRKVYLDNKNNNNVISLQEITPYPKAKGSITV